MVDTTTTLNWVVVSFQ